MLIFDYIILTGTVFEADAIARDVWSGVERGKFLIHHGFDGFMLANLTAGMSPVHSLWDATTQVRIHVHTDGQCIQTQFPIVNHVLCAKAEEGFP